MPVKIADSVFAELRRAALAAYCALAGENLSCGPSRQQERTDAEDDYSGLRRVIGAAEAEAWLSVGAPMPGFATTSAK